MRWFRKEIDLQICIKQYDKQECEGNHEKKYQHNFGDLRRPLTHLNAQGIYILYNVKLLCNHDQPAQM